MNITFEGERKYICQKLAMCEDWQNDRCEECLSPDRCGRALEAVRKLNKRLILGNSGNNRMLFEEIRVCYDLKEFL